MKTKIAAVLTILLLLMVPAFSTKIDGNSTNSTAAWFNILTVAASASLPNFWDKTQSDGRYIQTELDPVWTADKPNYYTGAALDILFENTLTIFGQWLQGNDTIQNITINSLGNYSKENATIAHIGACPAGQYASATIKGGVTCSAPAASLPFPAFNSNKTYYSVTTEFELLPAAYNRITTTPVSNITSGVGTAMTFPTAASRGGDGGYFCLGAAATNVARFNGTNVTYMGTMARMNDSSLRLDMFGLFKTSGSLIMNRTFTGVAFARGTNNTNDYVYFQAIVGNAGTLTTQNTTFNPDTAWHTYEIIPNSTHWVFYIDSVLKAAVIRTNQPTTGVSTAGWWTEANSTTVRLTTINWMDCEGWRGSLDG